MHLRKRCVVAWCVDRSPTNGCWCSVRRHVGAPQFIDTAQSVVVLVRTLRCVSLSAWALSTAAQCSAVPVAWVTRASTTKPRRFSISWCLRSASFYSEPSVFLNSKASSSVFDSWESWPRCSPWKSKSGSQPPPPGGPSSSSGTLVLQRGQRLDRCAIDAEVLS